MAFFKNFLGDFRILSLQMITLNVKTLKINFEAQKPLNGLMILSKFMKSYNLQLLILEGFLKIEDLVRY